MEIEMDDKEGEMKMDWQVVKITEEGTKSRTGQ